MTGNDGFKRDARGHFKKGNKGGPGNPLSGRVNRLRAALINAVTEEDIQEIIQKLVQLAKQGDIGAAKEVLLRVLGKPIEADLIERLEEIEAKLAQVNSE